MASNRYREAIVVYEHTLPAVLGMRGPVPLLLAQAYVALNDELNAARVLRLSGKPENQISDEIRTLRDLA
jgi:hypothetical protein